MPCFGPVDHTHRPGHKWGNPEGGLQAETPSLLPSLSLSCQSWFWYANLSSQASHKQQLAGKVNVTFFIYFFFFIPAKFFITFYLNICRDLQWIMIQKTLLQIKITSHESVWSDGHHRFYQWQRNRWFYNFLAQPGTNFTKIVWNFMLRHNWYPQEITGDQEQNFMNQEFNYVMNYLQTI